MPIAVSIMHSLSEQLQAVCWELTASGLFFLGVNGHVDGFDWVFCLLVRCCLVELGR